MIGRQHGILSDNNFLLDYAMPPAVVGGFLHHGMLGDTALYIKEECKSYNKKDKVCSKRYDLGNNHILAQKSGKSRKYAVLKHVLQYFMNVPKIY